MQRRDKEKGSGIHLIQPTPEEWDQWREMTTEHPWQLTLKQFLERVVSEYGYTLCGVDTPDSEGRTTPYLKSPDGQRVVQLPATLGLEDQLDEIVTASLCRQIRIPPEDFGLIPEEPLEADLDDVD